ncbi:tetratricopeptide repeat protein [Desulfoluna sp.]|uniref:tetratricopeptide repeat protein n=1 Tax=Desulfoluna sp. TaxID=2045199 RepID=UPI002617DC11|nr:tetratricopeptide repeat protein [Desulfoluna sp.]
MQKPKNAQEGIAQLRADVAGSPDCGNSHYNLAVALMGVKNYDEAEACLNDAVGCSPTLAEGYVMLGSIALQRDDVEGCLYYNTLATKSRAGFAVGYGNIGFLELQRGNVEEAIKNLKKAIVHNSKFVQAYTTLANAYLMKGLVDESIEMSLKALEAEPDFPISHHNLGIAYLEKEDYAQAIVHFDKAQSMGYEVPEALLKEVEPHRV